MSITSDGVRVVPEWRRRISFETGLSRKETAPSGGALEADCSRHVSARGTTDRTGPLDWRVSFRENASELTRRLGESSIVPMDFQIAIRRDGQPTVMLRLGCLEAYASSPPRCRSPLLTGSISLVRAEIIQR
jgi:hypothetical protein